MSHCFADGLHTGLRRAGVSFSSGSIHTTRCSQSRVRHPRVSSPVGRSQRKSVDKICCSFVFVHGLNPRGHNDHPFETWTHANRKFWPTEFLAEDIPYARIFVYGYNSSVTHPQTMTTASIKDHANTLLNLLDLERGPQQVRYLNFSSLTFFHLYCDLTYTCSIVLLPQSLPPKIIFIGHSLGGLVIKQVLRSSGYENCVNSLSASLVGTSQCQGRP